MIPLSADDAPAFLARHHCFYDGVVRRADLVYGSASHPPSPDLVVLVDVQDAQAESGWCTMTLRFEGVMTFRVSEVVGTNVMMSPNGLVLLYEDSAVLADYSPVPDEDYNRDDFSASSFAVEARAVGYERELLDSALQDR